MSGAITYENVVKIYGGHKALDGLSVTFPMGKVTALLGPNGAGKTTAVSLLLDLQKPSSGRVLVGGLPAGHRDLKERMGMMLQESAAIEGLTVKETLQLFRSYYRKPLSLEKLLQVSGLEKEKNKKATSLSGGQKRRLSFAMALAGDPEMIVLDEPTVGMDVEARIRFWEVIRTLADRGRTIILTTHYLEEADAVADRIIVISEGKLIAEGTPEELKSAIPLRTITFKTGKTPNVQTLKELPGVEEVQVNGYSIQLLAVNTDQLLPLLIALPWDITDIQIQSANLQTIFRQLTEANSNLPKGEINS